MSSDRSELVKTFLSRSLKSAERARVEQVSRKIAANKPLAPTDVATIEAIILPDKRPVIDIVNDTYGMIGHSLWTHLNDPAVRNRLKQPILSTGRVELAGDPEGRHYAGTGFVVGTDLLMTNRHVAALFTSGVGRNKLKFLPGRSSGIDFVREAGGTKKPDILGVRRVRMIHPHWDMALLEVEGLTASRKPLGLSVEHLEHLAGTEIVVIGYPAYDPNHPDDVQRKVFRGLYQVKRLQPGKIGEIRRVRSLFGPVDAGTHDSSTLGGNSGSCVTRVSNGLVVGLHFAGRYADANYSVPTAELARDARIVDAGVNFVPKGAADDGADAWWDGIDGDQKTGGDQPSVTETERSARTDDADRPALPPQGTYTVRLSVPLDVTIRLGDGDTRSDAPLLSVSSEKAVAPIHDTDYTTRRGYDPNFLGLAVQAPQLTDPSSVYRWQGNRYMVPYHNFSLAMHAKRRLAVFTAANVDHSRAAKMPEPGRKYGRKPLGGLGPKDSERWFTDPRLPSRVQLPDRFFTRDGGAFDRGHLVRREDVAWGSTYAQVRYANGDTFHTTNCSPQTARFNQSVRDEDNWGDLENHVAQQAKTEKLCVMAGPVLADDDPVFVGVDDEGPVRVKIPTRYWKLIVAAQDGALQSFAFVREQDLSDVDVEFTAGELWRRYMISLTDLEERVPYLRFASALHAADQANGAPGEAVCRAARMQLSAAGEAMSLAMRESAIEAAASETARAWRVAKSLAKLRDQINAKAPNRNKGHDGTIGDRAHEGRTSDHNPWVKDGATGVVSAIDITHDAISGCDANGLVDALVRSRDSRIKYIIWNKRILSSSVKPWEWRPYNGKNAHSKHFHLSVKADKGAYDDTTNWRI
jgi:DNA/RNA endonuclease G (NUC1)/V8-like Glu-specific endopeptidase